MTGTPPEAAGGGRPLTRPEPSPAGAMLRDTRLARGLPQWQVAQRARISQSLLSALETGRRPVDPASARRLAPLLGLQPGDVLVSAGPLPFAAGPASGPLARSHRDIPALCPCDWVMTFTGPRPSGWDLARSLPGCPHHGWRVTR